MRNTEKYALTLYDATDKTSYLVNYNGDNEKIDTAIFNANTLGQDAKALAENVETQVELLQNEVTQLETDVIEAQTQIETNKTVSEKALNQSVSEYTHTKIGNEHNLILLNGTNNIKFFATDSFVKGDSFKVNDQLVVTQTLNGEALDTDYFKRNAIVMCFLFNSVLTFTAPKLSDIDIPKDIYSFEEYLTNKLWVDNRPIYRIVLDLPKTGATTNFFTTAINLDLITSIEVFQVYPNGIKPIPYGGSEVWVFYRGEDRLAFLSSDTNVETFQVTLEYVKKV